MCVDEEFFHRVGRKKKIVAAIFCLEWLVIAAIVETWEWCRSIISVDTHMCIYNIYTNSSKYHLRDYFYLRLYVFLLFSFGMIKCFAKCPKVLFYFGNFHMPNWWRNVDWNSSWNDDSLMACFSCFVQSFDEWWATDRVM